MALFFLSKEMLLVLTLSISLIRFGSSLSLFDYDIEITNDSPQFPMGMQCTINGKTGGAVIIKPETRLGFKVPLLVGKRSLTMCEMSMDILRKRFDVFDSDRDLKRCNGKFCQWTVRDGGLYLRINGLDVLQYRWH